MKIFLFIFCLGIGLFVSVQAQKTAPPISVDTLARVGGSIITVRDLIERIELMPWEGKEKPEHQDSSKIKALNSLVAERLLAIEGKHLNVGSDEISGLKIREMEKMFVRDELFKREVKQKVTVSENEIRDGLAKFAWQLHVAAIAVKDQASGDSLWRMLQKNISLTKIMSTVHPNFISAIETVQVNYGGLDTVFENTVYGIGRKKFSTPFISETYGWTVAVLLDRGTNPVYEKMNTSDRRIRVDEVIRQKKETIAASRFFAKILAPQKAKTDSILFFLLAKELRQLIADDSMKHWNKGLYAVKPEDVDLLLSTFRNDLRRSFVELSDRPLSFGESIEAFRNLRFGFPFLDENSFTRVLNTHLRTVIETELITREGYRQNLQYTENVQHDQQLWSNYLISRYLMWQVNDSATVSDDEVMLGLTSSLPEIGTLYEVNVQEVLCDSLSTAVHVLNEYSHGSSLSDLASAYSKRIEWKNNGGISQYISLNRYSDISCRAFLAEIGSMVGPIKVSEGYSVFKVLGKSNNGGVNMPTADSLIINIKNNLVTRKRSEWMKSYVANLAKNYTVEMRYKRLSAVIIQPANMFTRRMIGFGGTISASPVLYPNWEWMKEFQGREKILP